MIESCGQEEIQKADRVREGITVLILTFNEEPNIQRTLESVKWAPRILIIDSGSTDATLAIVRQYQNVEVLYRSFNTFAEQCNFGLTKIDSPWVLSIDADYELSPELIAEIDALVARGAAGYSAFFTYRVHGWALRRSLYPRRVVLYRRVGASYRNEGHGHRVQITGPTEILRGRIFHDDRKPLSRWLASQQRYALDEAEYLLAADPRQLSRMDRVRRMGWPAPFLAFIYMLLWKGCLFDGLAGWHYVLQRTLAEVMIALELAERRLVSK